MSRRFRKPLEKKSVREDRKGAKRGADKRGAGKSASAKGPAKPSFGVRASEKRGPASAGKFASRPPAREPRPEPVREEKAAPPPLPTKVQTVTVTADENNMRVDRFLEHRFPGLSFSISSASSAKASCA
jgi:23S rRNA pseudouridine955/2504/2580 synthase